MIEVIYIIPIVIAILARLYWWVMISEQDDTFWPDTGNPYETKNEFCLLAIIFWPLTLVIFVSVFLAIGMCMMIYWPFKYLRDVRLRRTSRRNNGQN